MRTRDILADMRWIGAAALIALATASCSSARASGPQAAPATRAACEAAGGTWGRYGLQQRELCNLPAPDAGKACTTAKDCASACVAPDTAPVGSRATGTCYARMLLLGTCMKRVEEGVVTAPLCAD